MTQWLTPPRVARWLLEQALPTDIRESVSGDLDEVFQRDCRTYGLRSARRRYWRQTISFTMHFVVERWRDRRRGGPMRVGISWLDFNLGFRMLSRYPMLTVVGSLAMAVAIAVCAGTFEVITRVTNPSLPLPDGHRIVGLNYWHRAESGARPPSSYDVLTWREGLRTLEDIGAFRLVQRNLIVGEQVGEPVDAAEISAAAFRVTGVPPLMGRVLVDADESPQSPAVVVLGNRLWKMRFGVVPALKVTRTNMEVGLRQASAGAGGIRMGGMWTGVIVAQIAATVLFTAVAYVAQRQAAGIASAKAAFPAEKYLAVRLEMDRDNLTEERASTIDESFLRRYEATARELEQRVAAEAGVAGVTLAERLPLMPSDGGVIELDDAGPSVPVTGREHFVTTTAVDLDFFEVFQAPVLAGRGFAPHDTGVGANTVVVNHLFVDQILAGRNAVGRRIRYRVEDSQAIKAPGPWFEIIGVVRDLVPDPEAPMSLDNPAKPLVYHTLGFNRTESYPLYLATHVRSGDPTSVLPTLRRIAAEISPALRLSDIQRLDQGTSSDVRAWNGIADFILLVSAIALVLSLAGIYAVTSFTVTRRTREIAVRVALGAHTYSSLPRTGVLLRVNGHPDFLAGRGML